ncbi:unnamed protein product [Moneuplotes crassus]|uniref:Uncharacterized protein n=1 Tax=Euplotes crassus TaxID=5936 RepID=A0AAD1XTT3_EUPCR|nr:unnamed protein product [Moneuplotes crassus]
MIYLVCFWYYFEIDKKERYSRKSAILILTVPLYTDIVSMDSLSHLNGFIVISDENDTGYLSGSISMNSGKLSCESTLN